MIKCYLLGGNFQVHSHNDFDEISKVVENNRHRCSTMPLGPIIELLGSLGKAIIRDRNMKHYQGISYISLWLRKGNLKNICKLNYSNLDFLDTFADAGPHLEMYAQPRGIVCHWVAGNMPTLSFFSVVQAILSRNGSILKVPENYKSLILDILKILSKIEIDYENQKYYGKDVVDSISVVSFDGHNYDLSKQFSLAADCKLVYGGSEAIKTIVSLPQKEWCETIVYGPKYSFSVFDREYIESNEFEEALRKSVTDVSLFNQMACSSPQVFFFENSKYSLETIAEKIKFYFENLPEYLLHQEKPQWMAANTINARAMYLLQNDTNIIKSDNLDWTILIDRNVSLEEPIHGKSIFIKEVHDIEHTLDLITRKIQAINVCIFNEEKKKEYSLLATYKGVDRITNPGHIHDYDMPWDGVLPLNRLVRWVILKK